MTIPTRRDSAPVSADADAHRPRFAGAFVFGAGAIAWLLCIVPTGLDVRELAAFMGPGAMLWISFGAAVHMVRRHDVSWRSLVRWTLLGAVLLPPVLAFLVGVAGMDRPTQLLTLFTVGPWFVLIIGAVLGTLVELRTHDGARVISRGGTNEERHPTAPRNRREVDFGSPDQGEGDRRGREVRRRHPHWDRRDIP